MRDKNRIPKFMDDLYEVIHSNFPNAGFADVINVYLRAPDGCRDPFYMEEDRFLASIKTFSEVHRGTIQTEANPDLKEIMEKFGEVWTETVPDWRFCQILINYIRETSGLYMNDRTLFEDIGNFISGL